MVAAVENRKLNFH